MSPDLPWVMLVLWVVVLGIALAGLMLIAFQKLGDGE